MGESLDRGHVMAISLWDDVEVNMLWLDSAFPLNKPATDPGVQRGDCPGGEESTPTYLRQNYPDGWVSFQNAFVGPIGSFLSQPPTPSPGGSPSPQPQPMPSPGPCSDDNQNCGSWAASGQCEANPVYMLANCRLSCGVCSPPTQAPAPPTQAPAPPTPCTDENQNCGNWAASGQCEAIPAYMLVNCALSCGVCSPPTQAPAPPPPPPCTDENQNCGNWAASGQCQANPAYMLVNCRSSCGVCSGLASLKNTKKHV